jgi:hypothetical protein
VLAVARFPFSILLCGPCPRDYTCSAELDAEGANDQNGVSCYAQFIQWDAQHPSIFDDMTDPNMVMQNVHSSSGLLEGYTQARFCKACSISSASQPGDTCWAITRTTDNHRGCGCNSGGWTGTGVYYGGWPSGTCNSCGCQGGRMVSLEYTPTFYKLCFVV